MGLFKKLFGFRGKKEYEEVEAESEELKESEAYQVRREDFDLSSSEGRETYVRSLLDQLQDAKSNVKSLSSEYQSVTSYLCDIEELDALPKDERSQLIACCKNLQNLETSRNSNPIHKGAMSDEQFHEIEANELELEEGIVKLRETEDYQSLIHHDLKRLDAEHQAFHVRRRELAGLMMNLKTVAKVCLGAMGILIFALVLFQIYLKMDVRLGYIMAILITATVLTIVFVRFKDADQELDRINRNMDKLILLQNRVKIRYVNNTNLLDYYYLKYGYDSSRKIEKLLEDYRREKELRAEYARVMEDLDYYQKDMLRLLRKYNLFDPTIWIYQYEAILNPKEMVEIRHKYNVRRQTLRKQIENGERLSDTSMEEIRRMVLEYKEDSAKILSLLDEYEEKNSAL
ncbi:MAG: hypothetical protein KBS85_00450 [Lachnospiraceae bacterium]|nr:hypothetical protein [Candidatus Merdinaster equi]